MRIAQPIILLIISLLLVASVAAHGLEVKEVTVTVDGDSDDLLEGETFDIKPGEDLNVKVQLENINTNDDLIIEDIEIEAVLEGIDDGDDLEEDSDERIELKAGRGKTETIRFELPNKIDHDDEYTLRLIIKGEENGTDIDMELEYTAEVDKKNHDIRWTSVALSSYEAKCNQEVDITGQLLNMGYNEEEDVAITVRNDPLDLDFTDVIDMSEDIYDDSNEYNVQLTINPQNVIPGDYQILLRAVYDKTTRTDETLVLNIKECPQENPEPQPDPTPEPTPEPEEDDADDDVIVTQPPVTTTPTTNAPVIRPITQDSSSTPGMGLIIALVVLLAVALIALVVVLIVVLRK